ncbi:MAG TPA: hypothetical protein VFA90_03650 [Terriglobales bacterium]|nr:hypothetical protein [Terriglobales bacterium]
MFPAQPTAIASSDSRPQRACSSLSGRAPFHKSFSVGGLTLKLLGDSPEDVDGGSELRNFECEAIGADIELNIRWTEELSGSRGDRAFDSGATWRLFPSGNELVFEFISPVLGTRPYRQLRVNREFRCAELLLSNALRGYQQASPVEYPVCELLVTNYLAQRGLGVEVHGCGVIDREGEGFLFLGHSGAGKSTMARVWDTFRGDAEILSDDRLILRLHDGELRMHGTPWHGEAAFAAPGNAKLKNIFVLQHGAGNSFSQLKSVQAVGEIFARCFPPFHSAQGLERTVEFLKQIVDLVPCYEFQFLPDQSAIASVLAFHE